MTKNPGHEMWRVLRGPRMAYDLSELADWVDLPKFVPKRKPEEIGLGRNVTIFESLRQYAYRHIRHYKGDVRNFVLWQAHLSSPAMPIFLKPAAPIQAHSVLKICPFPASLTAQ